MIKAITVTTQFDATHCWPDCNLPPVSYLTQPHRHIFWVRVSVFVKDDRQIEFISFKKQLDAFILMNYKGMFLGSKSCEKIAEEILIHLNVYHVSVFEDNENGAEVWSED